MSQSPSENARAVASYEIGNALRAKAEYPAGHYVQQAIDSATAAKEREIKELNRVADVRKQFGQVMLKQRDALQARIRELEQQLAESYKQP